MRKQSKQYQATQLFWDELVSRGATTEHRMVAI